MLLKCASIFLLVLQFPVSFAIKCYYCNQSVENSVDCTNLGECEGEFCYLYNYTTARAWKRFVDRGCITGIKNITVGCYQGNPDFAQECFCNTDHCNNGFVLYDAISKPKIWNCTHWDSEGDVETEYNGYRCMVTFTILSTAAGRSSRVLQLKKPVCKLHHRFDFALFPQLENPGDSICITEPAGLGRRATLGDPWVECECVGDHCNRPLDGFEYPQVSEKVRCRSRHEVHYNATLNAYDYDKFQSSCTGDYCYESARYPQTNETDPPNIPEVRKSYGCWSTTHKPISMEVSYVNEEGMRYHLRLCETDFCTGEI